MNLDKSWKLLARVPVDSGQLLLVDPCYIGSHWKEQEFRDIRRYYNIDLDRTLQYRVDFERFDEVLPEFGKDMNDLIATGEWTQLPELPAPGLNYEAVCHATLSEKRGGEVDDIAAAFSTGYGDGCYPVYVKRGKHGRIMQVLIDFGPEDEE